MLTRTAWVLLLAWPSVLAQTDSLAPLRATLQTLYRHRQENPATRGATADLTVAKHQLRDWFEQRLAKFDPAGNEVAINREFQEALAGLRCPDGCVTTALGFADPVRVHRQGEFLTVQTSLGIACGYDDSAYVYEWRANAWRRIFETEQNIYTRTDYRPQTIYSVQISPADASGSRLALTLGSRPGCSGAFQPLYYRIWGLSSKLNSKPKLLLDGMETAYVGDYPPVKGSISADDVAYRVHRRRHRLRIGSSGRSPF